MSPKAWRLAMPPPPVTVISPSTMRQATSWLPWWKPEALSPSKSTIASDGGALPAPGVTTGGTGRCLSCTRHSLPGSTGVSV
jgi:hypothetical protein